MCTVSVYIPTVLDLRECWIIDVPARLQSYRFYCYSMNVNGLPGPFVDKAVEIILNFVMR